MIERWGIRARVTFVAFVPMLVVAALMTATHTGLRLSDLTRPCAHAPRPMPASSPPPASTRSLPATAKRSASSPTP